MPSLFVIRGNDQGSRFEFDDPVLQLGRDPSSMVRLHDTEVSRQHAEIRFSDDIYEIIDHGSSNGTFVNGRRIERHVLDSGDQIQLGKTMMLYTGPSEGSSEDLAHVIDIAWPQQSGDQSRIIHSITQEDGSRVFDLGAEASSGSWLARAKSNLQVMYRTALAVSHTLDIDQLLQRIMELIFEWVETDRGCIMLFDADSGELVPKVRRAREKDIEGEKITISKTILDYVIERNEGVLTSDAKEDERWSPAASILKAGIREAICVPMQGRYDVVGVIYIDTSTPAEEAVRTGGATKFKEDHLKLMIAIAHQAALAVEDTRYYSAMVQAERLAAMGQTIASLSHHIKNILQGIRGGSYLIEMGLDKEDPTTTKKGWKIVEKNQNKISALVMDMLTFSKEREPDRAPADLNEVVGDVVELMNSRAGELEVELHWQPDASIEQMVFDAEAINRAVLNVVTNALDAAHENEGHGCVNVSSGTSDDGVQVWVVVEDNGPGIPEEVKETLFSPFVSSKGSRGTGLGLPVSQKIFTEHGGQIEVEDLPGQGTRFKLEMPIVPVPPEGGQTVQH